MASHVYISTLVGLFIFDFVKIKVINQISVYLLRIPSLHYLAEIGLPCAAITWRAILDPFEITQGARIT